MAIEVLANLFSGPGASGNSLIGVVGNNQRYNVMRADLLQASGLYEHISSVSVFGSAAADASLLLFTNDDFSGSFLQISDTSQGATFRGGFIGVGGSFKSSLLISSNHRGVIERPFSFRNLFQAQWDQFIDNSLAGTRVSRVGEPTLTWTMFPENVEGLDSNLTFLKIYQPLNVDIPFWPDYSASLAYYIFLFPNFNHNLRAFVVRSETWVDSGLFHDNIFSQIEPKVDNGLSVLMQQINNNLSAFDGALGTVTDVYYLPGNHVANPGSGFGGNTDEDITILVVSKQA